MIASLPVTRPLDALSSATAAAMDSTVRIVERQRTRLLRWLAAKVGDTALAEDLLHEAFLRAATAPESAVHGLRDDESVVAWFKRVLSNAAIDHWRRKDAEARALERLAAEESGVVVEDSAGDTTMDVEELACTCSVALLDTLKPEYADILRELEMNDASISDYAKARGLSTGNVAVRRHRAREALRKRLLDCCSEHCDFEDNGGSACGCPGPDTTATSESQLLDGNDARSQSRETRANSTADFVSPAEKFPHSSPKTH